jgi:hypothetical protein
MNHINQNTPKLWRVTFQVRLDKYHPRFFDFQFGWLSFWLFAESSREAADLGAEIIGCLPYEPATSSANVVDVSVPGSTPGAKMSQGEMLAENMARGTGLGICLFWRPLGEDDPFPPEQ